MTINKQFILEEINIYSGSTNVSVKSMGHMVPEEGCYYKNWNSAQDLRRVSVPCLLGKDLSFYLVIVQKHLLNSQSGVHRANKALQGNTV